MPTVTKNKARIRVQLPSDLKEVVEQAAALVGQTVDDFAASSVVQTARKVIDERNATQLSNRDRDIFVAMLDDADAKPTKTLTDAAARYKKHIGQGR